MKESGCQYVIVNVHDVAAIVDEIYSRKGDVLAINAPSTRPGQAPQTREIWFFCSTGVVDICRAVWPSDIVTIDKNEIRFGAAEGEASARDKGSIRGVNINSFCWVRLTPHGVVLDVEAEGKPDGDGWTRFQLWELMKIYGPHHYNGATVCFEKNEIYFECPVLEVPHVPARD